MCIFFPTQNCAGVAGSAWNPIQRNAPAPPAAAAPAAHSGAARAAAQLPPGPQASAEAQIKQLKLRALACKRKGQLPEAKKLLAEAKQMEKAHAAQAGSAEDMELMQQLHELGWQGEAPGKQARSLPRPSPSLSANSAAMKLCFVRSKRHAPSSLRILQNQVLA